MEANEQTKMAGNRRRSKLFHLLKKYQQWVFGKCGIIITLLVTLVGFLISIGNDNFSQFNYNHTDIWNDFCTSNHITRFDEIVETQTMFQNTILFLMFLGQYQKEKRCRT